MIKIGANVGTMSVRVAYGPTVHVADIVKIGETTRPIVRCGADRGRNRGNLQATTAPPTCKRCTK